jgi:Leucine-rich repeat (LRR) protein
LPDSVGELKELRTLMIHHARISCLPVGVTELNKLEILSVRYCPLIEMPFPTALADPKGRRVPDSSVDYCIGLLRLKDLDLHGTRIKELSFPRGFCPNLQRLNISHCLELLEVGALPTTLVSLRLQHSYSLKKIEGLSGLGELRLLDISECKEIEELPGVETLTSLEELRGAFDCQKLKKSVRRLAQATIDGNRKRKS